MQPTLLDFFDKLRTIKPVSENLHYDTFPNFDFARFVPSRKPDVSQKVRYVVGTTVDKKIRTISFINGVQNLGIMSVYDFQSFKILTLRKAEVALSEYPDFPVFCVARDSRFIVYLNKRFEYGAKYKAEDIASVHILSDDLRPAYILAIRDSYIRMLLEIKYVNGQSTVIDKIRAIVVFQSEKDKQLLVSSESQFSKECYIPKADFTATLQPTNVNEGVPHWLDGNGFDYE